MEMTEYTEALDTTNYWHKCCKQAASTGYEYTGENVSRWSAYADEALQYAMQLSE